MARSELRGDDPPVATSSSALFGASLVLAGSFLLWQAIGIERTRVSSDGDPGARIFPLLLSVALLIGGVVYLTLGLLRKSKQKAPPVSGAGRINAWMLVIGLAACLPLISKLGFSLVMATFCSVMLTKLGARWYVAAFASVLLISLVKVLFTVLFEVQLPEGDLEPLFSRLGIG